MKTIDGQSQPVLSFGRTLGLALSGVRYRLFRAAVTVTVIAVAMAFLANILCESLIKGAVAVHAREGIREMRLAENWVANLSVPMPGASVIARLAHASPDAPAIREIAGLADIPPETLAALGPIATQAQVYLQFFESLDYGRRRVLIGTVTGPDIFRRLSDDEAAMQRLFTGLQTMRSYRFPTDRPTLDAFLMDWPRLEAWIGRVRDGQADAIHAVHAHLQGRHLLAALAEADGPFGAVMSEAGFALAPEDRTLLAARARDVHRAYQVEASLAEFEIRQNIAARLDILPSDVSPLLLWDLLRDEDQAGWLLGRMRDLHLPTDDLTTAELAKLADAKARERLMMVAELATADAGGGFLGLGQRMTWLAFVSMLVCVVGIANAMLMSVTERFREIATLKCLGALDGFIMTIFLIEAAMLGMAGGVAGAIGGVLLGIIRMLIRFRGLLMEAFPVGPLLAATLISIGVGVLLAAVAAVYPSLRAAKLAPMEAMRIE